MADFEIRITVRTWPSRAWVRLMRIVAPFVGQDRAYLWGLAGSYRLARWRIGNGRWRRMDELSNPMSAE